MTSGVGTIVDRPRCCERSSTTDHPSGHALAPRREVGMTADAADDVAADALDVHRAIEADLQRGVQRDELRDRGEPRDVVRLFQPSEANTAVDRELGQLVATPQVAGHGGVAQPPVAREHDDRVGDETGVDADWPVDRGAPPRRGADPVRTAASATAGARARRARRSRGRRRPLRASRARRGVGTPSYVATMSPGIRGAGTRGASASISTTTRSASAAAAGAHPTLGPKQYPSPSGRPRTTAVRGRGSAAR